MNKENVLRFAVLAITAIYLILTGFAMYSEKKSLKAQSSASGDGIMIIGENPYNLNKNIPIKGEIEIKTADKKFEKSDRIIVHANFTVGKSEYFVLIEKAMPSHPYGLYDTFFGVVYNQEIYGNSGIGTSKISKINADIALWGWADITLNGKQIAKMVPAQITVEKEQGINLEISTEEQSMINIPNGYLHVIWPKIDELNLP